MPRISYNPTITFGNILTIISMLGALVGLYITHDRRIAILEVRNANSEIVMHEVRASTDANTRAVDRLTAIIDERGPKSKL